MQADSQGWRITGATVVSMDPSIGVIPDGEVVVEGGRITYVGPNRGAPGAGEDEKGERVSLLHLTHVHAPEHALLPGFVNAHNHAAMTLLRGYADDMTLQPWLNEKILPAEARLRPEGVYWGTLLAAAEMLLGGTTTFADMYFHMDQAAQACVDAGIRASLARGLVALGEDRGRTALREAVEFVERWEGAAGRISTMLGPHAPYTCPPDYLREVIAAARSLGVPVHIHLAETDVEVRDIEKQYGRRPVRLMDDLGLFDLPVLAAHCVHVDEEEIGLLAQARGGVAHNPVSNQKLASGVAPVGRMLEAGVTVALGTDGAASTNTLGMFKEMRAAAWIHKVENRDPTLLPARQVLEMATLQGAKVLGMEDRIGSLTPGKRADMFLLDLRKPHLTPRHDLYSLLVYSAQESDVRRVWVDGRLVVDEGRLLAVDEAALLEAASREAARLLG